LERDNWFLSKKKAIKSAIANDVNIPKIFFKFKISIMRKFGFRSGFKSIHMIIIMIFISLTACQKSVNEKSILQSDVSDEMISASSPTSHAVATKWYSLQLRMILNANPAVSNIAAIRLFAYSGISLYESARFVIAHSVSLHGQLYQLPKMPVPDMNEKYSWVIVANAALARITRNMFPSLTPANIASIDSLENAFNSICLNPDVVNRSKAFGNSVAAVIFNWAKLDLFDHAADPYTPPVFPGAWVPTPPLFVPAALPYLGNCRPFLQMHSHGTTPPPLYSYSEEKGSDFYKMVKNNYNISKSLTDDQRAIALFWNDVGIGVGYTPMGHNISIVTKALRKSNASLGTAITTYARAGMAMWDANIVCWRSKYKYNLLRPVTYIRKVIDTSWLPLIGTPPHPEYPAAHAFITTAVMKAVSSVLGENFAFTDHTYDFLGFTPRKYNSFEDAALECGKSRFYGGIHYIPSIETGHKYGNHVGQDIAAIKLTE
jgi:hypothetical protein